jgi:hypothetical protein
VTDPGGTRRVRRGRPRGRSSAHEPTSRARKPGTYEHQLGR